LKKINGIKWKKIYLYSDELIISEIITDKVDILIDLAGHTAFNGLEILDIKPSPIQISYIGYPNTTGVLNIDYKIVDNYTNPSSCLEKYSEKLLYLENCFLCYTPNIPYPQVSELPCKRNGYITFGTFNAILKINENVIKIWSTILKSVKNSKLILKAKSFKNENSCKNFILKFNKFGIEDNRLILLNYTNSEYESMELYSKIDISLDTFPYNGTTTTCESLFMGVPVICIKGDKHVSNVGVSLLTNVGLPNLVTNNSDEYILKAISLSTDITYLDNLRKTLRKIFETSTLFNSSYLTNNLENIYIKVWNNYCNNL